MVTENIAAAGVTWEMPHILDVSRGDSFPETSHISIKKIGWLCSVNSAHFSSKIWFKKFFCLTVSCKINTWTAKTLLLLEIIREKSIEFASSCEKKYKFWRFSAKYYRIYCGIKKSVARSCFTSAIIIVKMLQVCRFRKNKLVSI